MKNISSLSRTLIFRMALIHEARMKGDSGEDGCEL